MFAGIVADHDGHDRARRAAVLVDDDQSGRFRDFLVAPLRRGQLVLGYLLSAVVVAVILSLARPRAQHPVPRPRRAAPGSPLPAIARSRRDRRALVHRLHLALGAHRVVRPHQRRFLRPRDDRRHGARLHRRAPTSRSAPSPTPSHPSSPRCRSRRPGCCCVASSRTRRSRRSRPTRRAPRRRCARSTGLDLQRRRLVRAGMVRRRRRSWRITVVCTAAVRGAHPPPHPLSVADRARRSPRLVEWHSS